jgi:transposase-like protein
MLIIIGTTPESTKELVAIKAGYLESEQSWTELPCRCITKSPKLAIGDDARGYGKALSKLYPATRYQLCWVHKTTNV